jgi:3,4-dihydroxy 2-butanone 4-phosphate synthase/GTP cyclohydrolase II
MSDPLPRVADAIRAFEKGEIIVVTDDETRENEGDLILAAQHATPDKLAFIVRHTSGIVCAPVTEDIAARLHLNPMVASNNAPLSTAFTVSVDVRHGLNTGISAQERCNTLKALASPDSRAEDFVRPGHVFPLIARQGGVLMRSGHTEAAVDLCKLANLEPVGVICELVNDDGTVMQGQQVRDFAKAHALKQVSVEELIAWRQRQDRLVERVTRFPVQTIIGEATAFSYRVPWDPMQHVALTFGDIRDGIDVPVRIQLEAVADDVFGQHKPLERTLKLISEQGRGIVVYLREGSVGVASSDLRHRDTLTLSHDNQNIENSEKEESHADARRREQQWREIGLGAQILKDLGVSSIQLITDKQRHYVGLDGFGIEISGTLKDGF